MASAVPDNQLAAILRKKIEKLAIRHLIEWDDVTNYQTAGESNQVGGRSNTREAREVGTHAWAKPRGK